MSVSFDITTWPILAPKLTDWAQKPDVLGAEGGKAAAIAFTLIGTAKLYRTDPQAWFECVLAQIADHKITRLDERPWLDAAQEAQKSGSCHIAPSFSIVSMRARLS